MKIQSRRPLAIGLRFAALASAVGALTPAALGFGAATPTITAPESGAAARPARVIAFDTAELFLELNDTDGDLGIHTSIDALPWKELTITDPNNRTLLRTRTGGQLARQGLNQLFIESAEPSFDELAPRKFFRRFPEGRYKIEAPTLDGRRLRSTAKLSHVIAARPGNIVVNGVPLAGCKVTPYPKISAPIVVDWDPVTASHPKIGKSGPVEILEYQLVIDRQPSSFKANLELPPSKTQFQVPAEMLTVGSDFKYQVNTKTTTQNSTVVEGCFTFVK